jgi:hypothetical protein
VGLPTRTYAKGACGLLFCAAKRSSAFPANMPAGLWARVSRLGGFTRPFSGYLIPPAGDPALCHDGRSGYMPYPIEEPQVRGSYITLDWNIFGAGLILPCMRTEDLLTENGNPFASLNPCYRVIAIATLLVLTRVQRTRVHFCPQYRFFCAIWVCISSSSSFRHRHRHVMYFHLVQSSLYTPQAKRHHPHRLWVGFGLMCPPEHAWLGWKSAL